MAIELIVPQPKHTRDGGGLGYPNSGRAGAIWIAEGTKRVRVREHGESIHLRSRMGEPCQCCGRTDGVWTDRAYYHEQHGESCANLAG